MTAVTSADAPGHETVVLDLIANNGQPYQAAFEGRWLVYPSDDSRAVEDNFDPGACYGVAITRSGNIVMFARHVNDRWKPGFEVFPSLDEASDSPEWPGSIISMAALELGQSIPMDADK